MGTPTIKIFVLSHEQALLDLTPNGPEFEKVNLSSLDIGPCQSNQLGECRAFFRDFSDVDAEYIGFANARWNQKYFRLKTRLETLPYHVERLAAPGWVLAPWPAHDWIKLTLHHHPTMEPLVSEMLQTMALSPNNDQVSVWANDFICHRSVFFDWLRFWKTTFEHFYGRYGLDLPFDIAGTDPSRKSAFFFERVTTAYFANRPDVRIAPFE